MFSAVVNASCPISSPIPSFLEFQFRCHLCGETFPGLPVKRNFSSFLYPWFHLILCANLYVFPPRLILGGEELCPLAPDPPVRDCRTNIVSHIPNACQWILLAGSSHPTFHGDFRGQNQPYFISTVFIAKGLQLWLIKQLLDVLWKCHAPLLSSSFILLWWGICLILTTFFISLALIIFFLGSQFVPIGLKEWINFLRLMTQLLLNLETISEIQTKCLNNYPGTLLGGVCVCVKFQCQVKKAPMPLGSFQRG